MAYTSVFKRYELKYLITNEQKEIILDAMKDFMVADKYAKSDIRNIYFDTPSYRLIRESIEKPPYKEKLRIRSYGKCDTGGSVFIELKRKYDKTVYKRRIAMPEKDALLWLSEKSRPSISSQISEEIEYFLNFYENLKPVLFLSYQREAYHEINPFGDLRLTFDEDILCREDNISLSEDAYGVKIIDSPLVLMEVKCGGGLPLWLVRVLSREKIYKTSFSKYGTAYKKFILPRIITSYKKSIYY